MLKQNPDQIPVAENLQKTPYILCSRDKFPSRGLNHVFEGISREFAMRTGRKWLGISDAELKDLYPDNKNNHIRHDLFLRDHGRPDIIFGETIAWKKLVPDVLCISRVSTYTMHLPHHKRHLTCHHLDAQCLAEEKKIFEDRYPDIRHPLIAVLPVRNINPEQFATRLADAALAYPEATIFMCGSWRTEEADQLALYQLVQNEISARNAGDRVGIENFIMNKEPDYKGYNPYIGLIASADHVIVRGPSTSILSETLFTGKTPIFDTFHPPSVLLQQGLCHHFNHANAKDGFPTQQIEPINITSDIVDEIIRRFKSRGGLALNIFETSIAPPYTP